MADIFPVLPPVTGLGALIWRPAGPALLDDGSSEGHFAGGAQACPSQRNAQRPGPLARRAMLQGQPGIQSGGPWIASLWAANLRIESPIGTAQLGQRLEEV